MKKKFILMAAVLLAFFSCSDDGNMDSTDPVLNRNEFVFSKLGGTDTLYSIQKSEYQIHGLSLRNIHTGIEEYNANLSKKDTVFTDSEGHSLGCITYDGDIASSITTEWFKIIMSNQQYSSPMYIIEATPSESCPYSLEMAIHQKNGGASISVRYDNQMSQ